MELVFKIEGTDVKMYRGEAFCGILGTLAGRDDESIHRLLYRAMKLGEDKKATEIRDALGVQSRR